MFGDGLSPGHCYEVVFVLGPVGIEGGGLEVPAGTVKLDRDGEYALARVRKYQC